MEPVKGDNALERGLHVLERHNDPELVEAYKRYMQRVEELVGHDQVDTYVTSFQRNLRKVTNESGGSPVSEEEQALHDKVATDPQVNELYTQYLALAETHGITQDAKEGDRREG